MKVFIRALLYFSGAFGMVLLLSWCLNKYLIDNDVIQIEDPIWILGDSHAKCTFDPQIIENSANLAIQGESPILVYNKLKFFLEFNEAPEVVIMAFPYHWMATSYSEKRFEDASKLQNIIDRYYPFLKSEDLKELSLDERKLNIFRYNHLIPPNWNYLSNIAKQASGNKKKYPYIEGFERRSNSDLDPGRLIKSLEGHFGRQAKPSAISLSYLDSIISLKTKYEFELMLITTPVHPDYYDRIPDVILREHNRVVAKYSAENGVRFINYALEKLPENHYLNFDHTNTLGAKLISAKVNDLVLER